MERHSLCPGCTNCPEVIIEGDAVRIGEDANSTVLKREEWNVLVELIQSGAVVEDVAVPFTGAGPATLVRLALSKRQPSKSTCRSIPFGITSQQASDTRRNVPGL